MTWYSGHEWFLIAGSAVAFVYFFVTWWRFGRDKEWGPVKPSRKPPDSLRAWMARYIHAGGYDSKISATFLIEMAVLGYIRIEYAPEMEWTYAVAKRRRFDGDTSRLERRILKKIARYGERTPVESLRYQWFVDEPLSERLHKRFYPSHFVDNIPRLIPGALILLLCFVVTEWVYEPFITHISLAFIIWTAGWFWALGGVVTLGRTMKRLPSKPIIRKTIYMAALVIMFTIFEIFWASFVIRAESALFALALLVGPVMIMNFVSVIDAPTLKGAQLKHALDGFARFFEGEAGECFTGRTLDDLTEEYEAHLPYAVALDKETAWDKQFALALERAGHDPPTAYDPKWLRGIDWNYLGAKRFVATLVDSITGASAVYDLPFGTGA